MTKKLLSFLAIMMSFPCIASAQSQSPAQIKFFESNIRPALVKYCYECHSVEAGDSRAGLLVDSREGLLQGGDNGTAIVPGDPEQSLLWEAINWEGFQMPPSEKMPAPVIAQFKQWIEMGAPDPRDREILEFKTKITPQEIENAKKDHWAFQSPRAKRNTSIDELVTKNLDEKGLKPSQAADAFTLLRRMSFDLVGLPPTPQESQAFQKSFESNPDSAVREKVDELLDRPQFGERWGRHWMDVARYAESSGSRNVSYPHAWRYRDYVIDSFNDDTPYDRFIAEQIAGDLLPVRSDEQWQENLIATGFLAIGLKHHDERNPRKFMADMVDEQIDTMTQAVLGLTVACARCHDHKYDPIPTDDYYALAGILHSTKTYYGTDRIAQNHRPSELLLLPVADTVQVGETRSQRSISFLKNRVEELDREMAGMRGKDRRQVRNTRNRLASQLASLRPDGTPISFCMGVQDQARSTNARILLGGEVDYPAQEVPRGFLKVLGNLNFQVIDNDSSGRLQLAKAMTSTDNPLTARVMVNRIWMHLLGRPLVGTPSNFGLSGMKPENQALLDYLAVRFMSRNWSVKSMIREIVMSETYRQSSDYDPDNYSVDPDNKWLWRFNPRPIEAESLRDAMLAISGQLDLGRPLASPVAVGAGRPGSQRANTSSNVRSVYLPVVRDSLPESLDVFDFPDPNMTSPGRSTSIVPTQALYLMNSEFVSTQALQMAETLNRQSTRRSEQIRMAFQLAYGRPATIDELRVSDRFFREFKVSSASTATQTSLQPPRRGLTRVGRQTGTGRPGMQSPRMRSPGTQSPRMRSPRAGTRSTTRNTGAADPTLATFCQTLMASAEFRILN